MTRFLETAVLVYLYACGGTQAFLATSSLRGSWVQRSGGNFAISLSSISQDTSVSTLYSPPGHAGENDHYDNLWNEEGPSSEHYHQFWSKPQSPESIQDHIHGCLNLVNDKEDNSGEFRSSSTLQPRVDVISAEPPLLVIHDFLSSDMCGAIIQAALESGDLKRSTTGTSRKTSESRTSSTVWLRDEHCSHPLRVLAEKVSLISGLPPSHMENLQVCRYQAGQQFNLHTDHQPSFNELDCRGRLATCLIYLAEPENGGETWFPDIFCGRNDYQQQQEANEVLVPPRQGSAVFFFNTLERPGHENYSPLMDLTVDELLCHAGLPVQGDVEKWICNRWIHPIDLGSGVVGLDGGVAAQFSTPAARSALV